MTSNFSVAIEDRYFEDYPKNSIFEFGSISASESEIIEFARKYDPQFFHTDPERAELGPFKGLAASGWHTASMMMRLFVDHYMSKTAGLGSPGVNNLRWTKPVRPGDQLRIRILIRDAKRSRSKPDRGMLDQHIEVLNQNGDVVMSAELINFLLCRGP